MTPVIYWDMDGLVSNFVQGAIAHHKSSLTHEQVTQWGLEALMGIDPAAFWAGLGLEFWRDLEPYDDGLDLLGVAEHLVGAENVVLVSSPCDTPGCDEGKRLWVKRHLPDYRRRTFLGAEKHKLAAPCKVLVDDSDSNHAAFVGRRGRAVLPPRPWNARRGECEEGGMFNVAKAAAELEAEVKAAGKYLKG